MEEGGQLQDLQPVGVQLELIPDRERHLRQGAGVVARVFVLGLERVGQRLDRGEIGSLELVEPPGVPQRQRGDVGDAAGQAEVAFPERGPPVLGRHHDHSESVGLPPHGGNQEVLCPRHEPVTLRHLGHDVLLHYDLRAHIDAIGINHRDTGCQEIEILLPPESLRKLHQFFS